jgi:starch synthase
MKVLIVTPAITYLSAGMGDSDSYLTAKADGVMDQSAYLFAALAKHGLDVYIAMPNYLGVDGAKNKSLIDEEMRIYREVGLADDRIYRINDNRFIHCSESDSRDYNDNASISFAFQREVLKKIIPEVKPDLIHCNDWVTGLISAATRNKPIPCLLSLHNIHTYEATLSHIENSGISVKDFWRRLFFKTMPYTYEEAKSNNPVDLLASAIFGAHFIHTGSPTFLEEITAGRHNFIPGNIEAEITNKKHADCAVGIPIPVGPDCGPLSVKEKYDFQNPKSGKLANKKILQSLCGLDQNDAAPLFFWPSRLDAHQKGCHLLTEILYETVDRFWGDNLQVIVVANGVFRRHFDEIVRTHNLARRVAVRPYRKELSKIAYAASDFIFFPSLYEPCPLAAMTGLLYGALPLAHDTGGLHDIVKPLCIDRDEGNGFLFQIYGTHGLSRTIEQAMSFYRLPQDKRIDQIRRIMKDSATAFNIDEIVRKYVGTYERMLERPIANPF